MTLKFCQTCKNDKIIICEKVNVSPAVVHNEIKTFKVI